MKKLLIVGLATFALATLAGPMPTYLNGTTNIIAASTTNSYTGLTEVVFPVGNASSLTLGLGFACNGTNGNSIPFVFEKSIDRVNWESLFTWSRTANGTTVVYGTTNLTSLVGDAAFIRLTSAANANTNAASAVTNIYLTGYAKNIYQ